MRRTTRTPPSRTRRREALATWILQNKEAVLAGKHEVPARFLGGEAPEDFAKSKWQFPGMDQKLRLAFAQDTCNGCHHNEPSRRPIPEGRAAFYHVNPQLPIKRNGDGKERLSNFVKVDDMVYRKAVMHAYATGK